MGKRACFAGIFPAAARHLTTVDTTPITGCLPPVCRAKFFGNIFKNFVLNLFTNPKG
jgi:hypothetical protein